MVTQEQKDALDSITKRHKERFKTKKNNYWNLLILLMPVALLYLSFYMAYHLNHDLWYSLPTMIILVFSTFTSVFIVPPYLATVFD